MHELVREDHLAYTLTGYASDSAGFLVSTSSSGYVAAFGVAWFTACSNRLEGGVGCNPRVTFDGKVRNLGPPRDK